MWGDGGKVLHHHVTGGEWCMVELCECVGGYADPLTLWSNKTPLKKNGLLYTYEC